MNSKDDIGLRVECDKTRGTVKWLGEIEGTNGLWYGVDWDTNKKGKHDGTHKGIKYFTTRMSTSGSFVRPEKLEFGINIEEAVRGRYQNDTTVDKDLTTSLQRTFHARFFEVVGMEKIGRKQSDLSTLKVIVLDGWLVKCGVENLQMLLPSLNHLDLSNSLIPSWDEIAGIVIQLPSLKFLNLSGNQLELPADQKSLLVSFNHVTHLVLNHMLTYSWSDLLVCLSFFPSLIRVELSHNNLATLGQVPNEIMQNLEEIDIGLNNICDWTEICCLGHLPRLKTLNISTNGLKLVSFPDTEIGTKTPLFSNLRALLMAGNPLNSWDSVGELNKLHNLTEIILTVLAEDGVYFHEFAFARILTLQRINRSSYGANERKDNQIFYLRHFSNDYYYNGGLENPTEANLTKEFVQKHPTYLTLLNEFGAPADDRFMKTGKNQRIRDLKLSLTISFPDDPNYSDFSKTVLPSTKISKLKMMIKRHVNLSPAVNISLWYTYFKDGSTYEIFLENDLKDLFYYSVSCGDNIIARLS